MLRRADEELHSGAVDHAQPIESQLELARQAQTLARGDEHLHRRRPRKEAGDEAGAAEQVLEAVEDEQELLGAKVGAELRVRRLLRMRRQRQRGGDNRRELVGPGHAGERDEAGTVTERGVASGFERQAGLACAARAGDGEEPAVGVCEALGEERKLAFTAHERSDPRGEHGNGDRP